MSNRGIALLGSAVVAFGLFLPIATFPIVGTMNLFAGGTNWLAISIVILVAITIALALKPLVREVVSTGAAICVLLAYRFARLEYLISQMRSFLDQLKNNPFAGMAQAAFSAVQIQWGWLVLAAGAGAIVYAGIQERKAPIDPLVSEPDRASRWVVVVSVLLALLAPAWELLSSSGTKKAAASGADASSSALPVEAKPVDASAEQTSREKALYIAQNLKLYDFKAKYYSSMLDGRVPGVDFKIKNTGDRTLNGVTVKIVFQEKSGAPIAEEEYYPVLVTENGFGNENRPLRPGYIWQQESGKFYTAKNVPDEWQPGKATATITDLEFAGSAK